MDWTRDISIESANSASMLSIKLFEESFKDMSNNTSDLTRNKMAQLMVTENFGDLVLVDDKATWGDDKAARVDVKATLLDDEAAGGDLKTLLNDNTARVDLKSLLNDNTARVDLKTLLNDNTARVDLKSLLNDNTARVDLKTLLDDNTARVDVRAQYLAAQTINWANNEIELIRSNAFATGPIHHKSEGLRDTLDAPVYAMDSVTSRIQADSSWRTADRARESLSSKQKVRQITSKFEELKSDTATDTQFQLQMFLSEQQNQEGLASDVAKKSEDTTSDGIKNI